MGLIARGEAFGASSFARLRGRLHLDLGRQIAGPPLEVHPVNRKLCIRPGYAGHLRPLSPKCPDLGYSSNRLALSADNEIIRKWFLQRPGQPNAAGIEIRLSDDLGNRTGTNVYRQRGNMPPGSRWRAFACSNEKRPQLPTNKLGPPLFREAWGLIRKPPKPSSLVLSWSTKARLKRLKR